VNVIIVLVKLAHAMVGIWLVCGLVGRWATLAQAAELACSESA
jgi:hypothetical protein